MDFAEISKMLRKSMNLSQETLAKKLDVSKACISMIEIGKNEPTANTLLRYADFFQCSTDFLLGREDDFGNVQLPPSTQPPLSMDEQRLLLTYRTLSNENKMRVAAYADIRAEEERK